MSKVIFFDAGPLGSITNPKTPSPPLTAKAIQWAIDLVSAGHQLIVPAIADFEVRCGGTRAGMTDSLALLDTWNTAQPDCYLPLTDSAIKRAAQLWAQARNMETLPADPKELNGDVLIAAQILDYQATYGLATADIVIASVNVGHLSLFVPADLWTNIKP